MRVEVGLHSIMWPIFNLKFEIFNEFLSLNFEPFVID